MNNYYLVRDLDLYTDYETGDQYFFAEDQHWFIGLLVYVGSSNREYVVWGLTPGKVWVREP